MASTPDEPPATAATPRLAPFLRAVASGSRIVAARMRFLAVFIAVFAIIGGWETIRSYAARLLITTTPEAGISPDAEYFCPMDPGVVADWPSKCPVCNMSLVLRKRGDASPLPDGVMARMQLTPYRLWLGGVATSPVGYEPLARALELPGVVVGDPGGEPHVEAAAFAHELGWIEPGQRAEVIRSRDEAGSPPVGKVRDTPGSTAVPAVEPIVILDLESPSPGLRPGDRVRVRLRCPVERLEPFRGMPDRPPSPLPGEPRRVYACMNHPDVVRASPGDCPKDRAALMARPLLENQRMRWWCPMHPEVTADRPGAACEACGGMILVPRVISYRLPGTVLSVPSTAVIDDGLKSLVYVETGPGMFDARVVTLGPRCGESFPVLSGLEPGDRVVTHGAFLVDAETRLNPALAASYFGSGNPSSPGRGATTGTAATPAPDWLEGLSLADRPRALRQGTCPVTGKALGYLQSWACDLSEDNPSTVAPVEKISGIFYYLSGVRFADVSDGLSNTAFFSEKIRGTGIRDRDARSDSLIITPVTTLDQTLQTCRSMNPATATRLTMRQGMSWVMGEMCCTSYNHVDTPNTKTCAGTGFPGNMANMPMQVPPSSHHPGGVNTLLGDGSVRFVKNGVNLATWRALGTRNGGEVTSADSY